MSPEMRGQVTPPGKAGRTFGLYAITVGLLAIFLYTVLKIKTDFPGKPQSLCRPSRPVRPADTTRIQKREEESLPAKKYTAIYEDLKKKIEDGIYPPQSCLPTEFELVEIYSCSRNTIRRAVQELSALGYVQSIHGKGVVVIYQKSSWSDFSIGVIESLKEAALRNKAEYRTKVLVFTEFVVDERLHRRLGFEPGSEVYYLQRVRYFDNIPVILDNNWFLKSVVPGLTEEIAADSVYNYMENVLGQSIVTARRVLTVEKASEIDRKYLDMGDYDCLAVVTSRTFNADGVMFEYTQSRHRPDRFVFTTMAARHRS